MRLGEHSRSGHRSGSLVLTRHLEDVDGRIGIGILITSGGQLDPSGIRKIHGSPTFNNEEKHMATEKQKPTAPRMQKQQLAVSTSIEDLLLAALERGDDSLETGRYLVTYRDNATAEGLRSLKTQGFRVA